MGLSRPRDCLLREGPGLFKSHLGCKFLNCHSGGVQSFSFTFSTRQLLRQAQIALSAVVRVRAFSGGLLSAALALDRNGAVHSATRSAMPARVGLGSWLRENVYGRKIARIFFLGQPLNEFYRNTVRDANGSLSRIPQIKLSNCAAVRACDPPDAGTEF